jgi:HflK protein
MGAVVTETLRILNEAAAYLLLGFLLAGVLHGVVSRSPGFVRALRARGSRSVWLATLIGLPLPLCSCSVLPVGLALRKKGASKGATVAFLISAPETDIVSILVTYGLLGPVMAVFRPVAALVTALAAGLAADWADRPTGNPEAPGVPGLELAPDSCADYHSERSALWNILHYGFVQFFDDIIGSLVFGIVLGGAITALLPALGVERLGERTFLSMLAMLALGIPMYVCASASVPIAAGLIAGGLSPGAALVFLLAGPATNTASLLVLYQHLGRTVFTVYLTCIAVVSVLMGLALNALIGSATLPAVVRPAVESFSVVETGGAVVFGVLTVLSLRRTRFVDRLLDRVARRTGLPLHARRVKVAAVLTGLVAYFGSGLFIVRPGERAVVLRFGHITAAYLGPGLHYHWPYPFGRRDAVAVGQVRRIELGYRGSLPTASAPGTSAGALTAESWMLSGSEDIVDVKWVVQYQVPDTERGVLDWLYGAGNTEQLVRNAAEAAIRAAVGCRSIDSVLTTARPELEAAVQRDLLQPALDRCGAGVRVLRVSLVDVHAPPDVHQAFRDVASAAEEKMETINAAAEYQERVVRQAGGEAAQRLAAAAGLGLDSVARARGAAAAFGSRLEAYRLAPEVTRRRLYFEMIDATLGAVRKIIRAADTGAELDLWRIAPPPPAGLTLPPGPPLPPLGGEAKPPP